MRGHKSRAVSFLRSFSNSVHCRSTARPPPAAQPSNALATSLPAPSPTLPQSLVLPTWVGNSFAATKASPTTAGTDSLVKEEKISEKTVKAPPLLHASCDHSERKQTVERIEALCIPGTGHLHRVPAHATPGSALSHLSRSRAVVSRCQQK